MKIAGTSAEKAAYDTMRAAPLAKINVGQQEDVGTI